MKSLIIYDTGEGIIIYEADLSEAEAEQMAKLHNRYGGTTEMTPEEDKFLGDIENSIRNIRKVFDATSEDSGLTAPPEAQKGARIFVTGFVP